MSGNENKGIMLKRGSLVVAAAVVLLLVVGGVTLGLNWNNWFGNNPDTVQAGTPDIDPNAADWRGSELAGNPESGTNQGIAIPGYPSISIPAGTKNCLLYTSRCV